MINNPRCRHKIQDTVNSKGERARASKPTTNNSSREHTQARGSGGGAPFSVRRATATQQQQQQQSLLRFERRHMVVMGAMFAGRA